MNQLTAFVIALSLAAMVLIFLYVIKRALYRQKIRTDSEARDNSQVGFVVDTFHELVSKLKEKERELEVLRNRAEARASAMETYNENILQSVPSGVISFDHELKVTKMNSAAQRILGIEESDALGKDYVQIFGKPLSEMIGKKSSLERSELGFTTRIGKRIWLGLNISPLRDGSGNTIGRIVVFTDLTELKAFQSRKELREKLSNLGEMSAGIAHELRNPMAVISGYTKILARKADEEMLSAVDAIAKEIAVMDRIITDFLSFAKPKDPVLTDVDLKSLLNGCISAVSDGPKKIEITDEKNGMPIIRADEVLLRQAIFNLLQNAVDSLSERGKVIVRCFTDDCLNLVISDNGHGIPENIRDKIFLPFYTTKERGTGLGLSVVHKTILSHGGAIQVDSGEAGTVFTIRFPKDLIVTPSV